MRSGFVLALIAALMIAPAWAQEKPIEPSESVPDASVTATPGLPPVTGGLPPEAPSSLFRLGGGATDAEVTVRGSWKASLSSIPSVSFGSRGTSAYFSGSPLLFVQSPDIFLNVLLNGSWFLEAAFTEALDQSSFALGYRGEEGDFVKEVRAGNQGLSFAQRPFLDFGASGNKTFGIGASFGSDLGQDRGFAAQALLRFDSTKSETAVYIGLERLTELEVPAADFIQGKFFILPDANVEDIVVYRRSAAGAAGDDGFTYLPLDPPSYVYSLSAGTITFNEPLTERTLIAYRRADGLPVSAAQTATIEGRTAAIAFDPGRRTDCEILSRYFLPGVESQDGLSLEANVESAELGNLDTAFGTASSGDGSILEAYRIGEQEARSTLGRMPFAALAPEIYEPGSIPAAQSPIKIKVSIRQKKERLEIDAKAIPDTIRVRRNGVSENGFGYLPNSGYLELKRPPGDGERIEIEYMLSAGDKGASDIIAQMAFDYFFSESLSAYAAFGTRWSAPNGEVSGPDSLTEGLMGLSSGLAWKNEDWSAALDLGLRYARTDSRDACRIDGMEDFLLVQKSSDKAWTRSVLPQGFFEEGRADALFRDYRITGAFGAKKLAGIESGVLPEAADPLSRQGPYPVADGTFGTAYVAEFSLDEGKEWCGIQVMLDESLIDGLPQAQSIVLPLRFLQGTGAAPAFTLRAGMLGKSPFDGSAGTYPMDDPRYVSADIVLTAAPAESWAEYEIPLNPSFAAGLRKGASILLLASSSVPSSGRCLVGDIRLKGAAYVIDEGISRTRLAIEQAYADGPETAFPDQIAHWRGSSAGNGSLRMEVSGNTGLSAVGARKNLAAFPLRSYKKLSFYVRSSLSGFSDAVLTLRLADAGGPFLECAVPLAQASPWGRATIDLDLGTGNLVYADGSVTALDVSLPRVQGSDSASLSWSLSGIETGVVELDEVGLSEARSSFTYLALASASKSKTGALISVGGFKILSALEAKGSAGMELGTDAFGYSGQASAGMEIFPFALSASTSVSGTVSHGDARTPPVFRSGHAIALPFLYGSLESGFFQDSAKGDFYQKDMAKVSIAPVSVTARAGANQTAGRLSQTWGGEISAKVLSESIGIATSWENHVETENALFGVPYFRAWMESYAYLAPHGLERSSRRLASLGAFAGSAAEGSDSRKDFAASASTFFENGVSPSRGSEHSISISPLIKAGRDARLRIVPLYSRRTRLVAAGAARSFGEDIAFSGDAMVLLPSAWLGLPFAEFFDGKALGQLGALPFDPGEASQEATAGLGVELDAVLGLMQFVTPRQASYSLGRISKRSGSVLSESLVHQASLGMRAVDVLGSQGAFPVLKAFKTDEYGLDQKMKITQGVIGTETEYQYSASLFCLFGFAVKDKLDIRDDLRLGSGEERFSESLAATLSLSREAGPAWQALRKGLLERMESRNRDKAVKASSPLAENWLSSRMDRTDSFSAGVSMSLDRANLFSLSAPLAYEWILSVEKAYKISAGARLRYEFKGSPDYAQSELNLALSIQARVEF